MKAIANAAFFLVAAVFLQTLPAQSPPPNIIGVASRNVKSYGAKGDGVTDDTQAFIAALQSNRKLPNGVAEKAPPCLCASRHLRDQLDSHHLEEHPALWRVDRPAYAAFSPSFRQFSGRVEANTHDRYGRRYDMPDNTTDWQTRTNDLNGSTNNTFFCSLEDINVRIGANNPGAWGVFWFCAQQSDVRNVTINADDALGCLQTGWWGGGSTIANCNFVGGKVGYWSDATSTLYMRDCSFTPRDNSLSISTALGCLPFKT